MMPNNTHQALTAPLLGLEEHSLTEEDVKLGYRFILGRNAESDQAVREKLALGSLEALRNELLASAEFASAFAYRPRPNEVVPGGAGDLTANQVRIGYRLLLGRHPESDAVVADKLRLGSVEALRREFLDSEEFLNLAKSDLTFDDKALAGEPRIPPLTLPAASASLSLDPKRWKILLLGTCQMEPLAEAGLRMGHTVNHLLMKSRDTSPTPSVDLQGVDAVVVGLTLRHLLDGGAGGKHTGDTAIARAFGNVQAASSLVERTAAFLDTKVAHLSTILGRTPAFFMAFLEPSFDYSGVMADRLDYESPRQIVRRLNEALHSAISRYENFKFLDINEVANSVGRLHMQDDIIWGSSHASMIGDYDFGLDRKRIVAPTNVYEVYPAVPAKRLFGELLLTRVIDTLTVLRGDNRVKLLIVDLDDTLWRGVAAEDSGFTWKEQTEGWPLGLVEALIYFKRRGGLLAMCSKNDEAQTLERFKTIWHDRLSIEDFVSIKVNWRSKSENVAEILAETNLLPDSAVFIDDNPREVEEVRSRFPQVRTLGFNPWDWRRLILQAPQMQVASITAESAQRTRLVKAHAERESKAATVPRDQFLRELQIEQSFLAVRSSQDAGYERGLELLNKTNQFNTTGKRWSAQDMEAFFARGGVFLLASLKDKTVDNGIIAAALIAQGEILQTVLSCRVFNLGAEMALGSVATQVALYQAGGACGRIVDTGKNFSCHSYFENMGFEKQDDRFVTFEACASPPWIKIVSTVGLEAELEAAKQAAA